VLNKLANFVVRIVIISGCLTVVFFFYQSLAVDAQAGSKELSFAAETSKTEYLKAEPIQMTLSLTNQTNEPIAWRGILMIGRDIDIVSRSSTGQEYRWGGKQAIGLFKVSLKTMLPGAKARANVVIQTSIVEELFPVAGTYQVRLDFTYGTSASWQDTRTVSSTFALEIKEPKGIDQQAYEFMMGPLKDARRQSDIKVVAKTQQEFLDRFRNSAYSKYVGIDLARSYYSLGENVKALTELCKAPKDKFYLSTEVQDRIFEIGEKLYPMTMRDLPEDAPIPPKTDNCSKLSH
jgi:hypothetical protein